MMLLPSIRIWYLLPEKWQVNGFRIEQYISSSSKYIYTARNVMPSVTSLFLYQEIWHTALCSTLSVCPEGGLDPVWPLLNAFILHAADGHNTCPV